MKKGRYLLYSIYRCEPPDPLHGCWVMVGEVSLALMPSRPETGTPGLQRSVERPKRPILPGPVFPVCLCLMRPPPHGLAWEIGSSGKLDLDAGSRRDQVRLETPSAFKTAISMRLVPGLLCLLFCLSVPQPLRGTAKGCRAIGGGADIPHRRARRTSPGSS